jgi:cytochrome c oxidase subunit III
MAITNIEEDREILLHQGAGGGDDLDALKKLGGGDNDGPREPERQPPPEGYQLAIWLTLAGVAALFATLVVVYVWLNAQNSELVTPPLFWFSTVVVTVCSLTLEISRRQLRQRREAAFQRWLWLTMFLGLLFLAAQSIALKQLVTIGFFAGRNLRAWLAFFITGTHAAHLIGGLAALLYLIVKSRYGDWTVLRRRLSLDSTIIYWHFIDVLWILLFVMIFLWK